MLPIIHARFRKRSGVPIAIEFLSGRQYRCRHCNKVYFSEDELDRHVKEFSKISGKSKSLVDPSCPELSYGADLRVLYTYDIKDRLQKKWLKLRKDEKYDGI
jgi:hypothetical protein